MSDGIFRRKAGFTVVQNQIARDNNVSLKAKGLYLLIQSYITMPDRIWKKSDFEKYSSDGNKSFETAWNHLRDAGYLKWHRVYVKETGKFRDEFELLDEPKEGPYGFFYDKQGEITKTKGDVVLKKIVDNFAVPSRGKCPETQEISHDPLFGVDGKGGDGIHVDGNHVDGNHPDEKGGDNYNNCNNKDLDNNHLNNNNYKNNNCVSKSYPVLSNSDEQNCSSGESGQDVTGHEPQTEEIVKPVVILDSTELVDEADYYNVLGFIKDRNGICDRWVKNEEHMTQAIQILGGWNDIMTYGKDGKRNEEWEGIYVCMVRNLIEMCLIRDYIRFADGRKISYSHVIKQINCVYHKEGIKEYALAMFFDRCVERYLEASKKTKIKKIDEYCKPLLWNTLCSYDLDWWGYFNRTYYGDWSD